MESSQRQLFCGTRPGILPPWGNRQPPLIFNSLIFSLCKESPFPAARCRGGFYSDCSSAGSLGYLHVFWQRCIRGICIYSAAVFHKRQKCQHHFCLLSFSCKRCPRVRYALHLAWAFLSVHWRSVIASHTAFKKRSFLACRQAKCLWEPLCILNM